MLRRVSNLNDGLEIGIRTLYNLQRIEKSALSRAQYSQIITENREKYAYNADALSVAQLFDFVKIYDKKLSNDLC